MIIPPSIISSRANMITWRDDLPKKNTNYGHLQVVKERLLVNVLPEDLSDRIEEAVKDRHQKKLILLTASQLSNKTVKLAV